MALNAPFSFQQLGDGSHSRKPYATTDMSANNVQYNDSRPLLPTASHPLSNRPESIEMAYSRDQVSRDRSPSIASTLKHDYPRASTRRRIFSQWNWWYWEIGAAFLSALCLGATVALLVFLNGKSYSSWQYQVSPNAVISIVATVQKASLLVPVAGCLGQLKWDHYRRPQPLARLQIFSDASHGISGAFEMLYRLAPSLATIGALIHVLSIAVDPFTQQILSYPARTAAAHNETAKVQTTHIYSPDWSDQISQNSYLSAAKFSNDLDPPMQIAILGGLFPSASQLRPECSTGECDYPVFTSLGFCSQCTDVTHDTKQTCRKANEEKLLMIDNAFKKSPFECTYTTPSGVKIQPEWGWTPGDDDKSVIIVRDPWTSMAFAPILKYEARGIMNISDPLVGFASAKYTSQRHYGPKNASTPEQPPLFTEFALYVCEKSYLARRTSPSNPATFSTSSPSSIKTQPLQLTRPKLPDSAPLQNAYRLTTLNESSIPTFSQNSTYLIDQATYASLAQMLLNIFNTTTTYTDAHVSNKPLAGAYSADAVLWQSPSLSDTMANLAASMTDHIRAAAPYATTVQGVAYRKETYIRVRWSWLLLSASLTGLSTLFLVATMVQTARASARVRDGEAVGVAVLWKDSALAEVVHRLRLKSGEGEGEGENERNGIVERLGLAFGVAEMNLRAKGIEVRVERDRDDTREGEGGLALVER